MNDWCPWRAEKAFSWCPLQLMSQKEKNKKQMQKQNKQKKHSCSLNSPNRMNPSKPNVPPFYSLLSLLSYCLPCTLYRVFLCSFPVNWMLVTPLILWLTLFHLKGVCYYLATPQLPTGPGDSDFWQGHWIFFSFSSAQTYSFPTSVCLWAFPFTLPYYLMTLPLV